MSFDASSFRADEPTRAPLYEIRPFPGKGRGIVACSNIPKGTRILCEKPLLTLATEIDSLDDNIVRKVRALSEDKKRQYLSLCKSNTTGNVFTGIFQTNALPCESTPPIVGIFPTICLINHSCVPNSQHSWNSMKNSQMIHAVSDIEEGEEITICYGGQGAFDARRDYLAKSFGFECDCSVCSLPIPERQESDARRTRIEQLDKVVGNMEHAVSKPGTTISTDPILRHISLSLDSKHNLSDRNQTRE